MTAENWFENGNIAGVQKVKVFWM